MFNKNCLLKGGFLKALISLPHLRSLSLMCGPCMAPPSHMTSATLVRVVVCTDTCIYPFRCVS